MKKKVKSSEPEPETNNPKTLTSISFNAMTRDLRASSRVGPLAKRWPNCESANSWMPPFAPTEKYPQTFGVDWNLIREIVPEVGLKPSSGFSAVMRAAITWFWG